MNARQLEFLKTRAIIYPLLLIGILIFKAKGWDQAIGKTNTIILFLTLAMLVMVFSVWNKRYLERKYSKKK